MTAGKQRHRSNAFVTVILRSIRHSLGRFFAIIGIVAFGCGFFAGLQMSGPDMRIAADNYYDGANLWDIRLISTLGFSDDDVERIRDIDGIDAVMPSISTDVMMDFDSEQVTVRINLLPESAENSEQVDDVTVDSDDDDYLNRLILRDGRWPTAADECVILADASASVELGDTISVLYGSDDDTLDDTLVTREFTVVGTVSSANYPYTVSFGSTTLGSGMIHQVLFTPRDAFTSNAAYTEIYATVDGASDYESGSDDYQAVVDEVTNRIDNESDNIAEARLEDLRSEAQEELDEAAATLADYQEQLEQAQAEYESQLADAQAEIDDLEAPDIYILDRTQSEGAASYESDSERIDSIANVFPFIFFLVAALVALTTMTRMVEDERVEIGTYKALGYATTQIASKYLVYAALASVVGAVLGIGVLCQILPYVIMQAYGIIYAVPSLSIPLPILPVQALLAGGLGVGVTLLSTWCAVVSSLRETPAQLMVPRPPKAGKRILLEHIGPLWKRMSFSWKVTCRNIFRYKKRFFMTIIGISGCTALMLVGFGLHDSIWDIIDNQYGSIQQYDIVISMDDTATQDDVDEVTQFLTDNDTTNITQVAIENMCAEGDDELSLQVVIPENTSELTDILTFRDRASQQTVTFDDDSVLITEKAATTLSLSVGDSITLYRQDSMGNSVGDSVEATVSGIVEYYVGNAVFVGPNAWADMATQDSELDVEPDYDTLYAIGPTGDTVRSTLSEELREIDHVSTVTLSETSVSTYTTMLNSINVIVVILIVAAAALAFIVLINLTNINIGERVREIATLKVLGFTRGEIQAYIFREVAILSLVGDLIGLVLGTVLEDFVITTVEVSAVMFGRSIHMASYLCSFALTMVFTAMVVLIMRRKLDRVDMVESLKSVD